MADNNLEKFQNSNPLQQWFIKRFFKQYLRLFSSLKDVHSVLDVGCGEGFTLRTLQSRFPLLSYAGIDPDADALRYARAKDARSHFQEGSIYQLPFGENEFDVVLCNEVLEHLEEPEKAMLELRRVAKKYIILSVPHEPWFRLANFMRGRNIKRFGNYPYHIQYWTRRSFLRFVGSYAHIEESRIPFPWILALAKKVENK